MNKTILLFFLFTTGVAYSQQWKQEGPFYGKSQKEPYLHAMGLVDEVFPHPTDTNTFLISTNSSGIFKTTNRGIDWKSVTDHESLVPGMGVLSIVANPDNSDELYAAAGNIAYGFDTYGGGVLRSTNWGETWETVSSFDSVFDGKSMVKIVFEQGKLYAVGENELFVSSDGAKTWKSLFKIEINKPYIENKDQGIADFEVMPNGNLVVSTGQLWGASGNCYLSMTNGNSWENLENRKELKEIKEKRIVCSKLTTSTDGKLMVAYNDGKKIYLYESVNQGEFFYKKGEFALDRETGDAKSTKFELEYSLDNPDKLYLGFIEFFEWDSISGLRLLSPSANISAEEHDDVRAMRVYKVAGQERVLMGNDGGISVYYPHSKRFESLNGYKLATLQVYNLAISQHDSNFTMLIGTQDNGTYKYQDNQWNFIDGGDGGGNILNHNAYLQAYSMNSLIVVWQGKIKKFYSPNTRYSGWFLDSPIEISPVDSVLLFGSKAVPTQKGALIYFQNIQSGPRLDGIPIPGLTQVGEIAVSNKNPNKVWVAEGEHLDKNDKTPRFLKTQDRGKTFIDLTDAMVFPDPNITIPNRKKDTLELREMLSYRTITDIEIDPYDDEIVYVSLSGYFKPESWTKSWEYYRVLKSQDGGESWYDYSYGLPVTPIHCLLRDQRDEDMLFCGGDESVYYKDAYSSEWKLYGEGFPQNVAVTDLKINYCQYTLYSSTYGRGVYSVDLSPIKDRTQISKDTEIATYQFVNRNIEVKRGKTLTIKSEMVLGPSVGITLEPKSQLIIDGGSVSGACTNAWSGITIEEKKFLFFFKRKRGEVILKNGGELNQ